MSDEENVENLGDNSIEVTEVDDSPPPIKVKGKQKSSAPIIQPKPASVESESGTDEEKPVEIESESELNIESLSPIIKDIAANSDLMSMLKARSGDFVTSQEFKAVEFQYNEACRIIKNNEDHKLEMEKNGIPTNEQTVRWGTYQSYIREIENWTNKKQELQGKVALKLIGSNLPIPK